jgi:addiction module RelB/DinJ family antitoxin
MSIKTKISKTPKKTKVIQTRLDEDLVNQANEILDGIGLTTSDIFRVLLKKVVATGEVPLSLTFTKPYYTEEENLAVEKSLISIENGEEMPSLKYGNDIDSFLANSI